MRAAWDSVREGQCAAFSGFSWYLVWFAPQPLPMTLKGRWKQFGLMGAWSPDCSKDIYQPTMGRVTFAAPSGGQATATILDKHGGVLVTTVDQVTESAIVASDESG